MSKNAILAFVVIALALVTAQAEAFPRTLFEVEPNDQPEQAQSFRGEARLIGDVRGGDVDHFVWVFDDEEAVRHWNIELRAARPDSGIRLRLSWPGEAAEAVFEFGTESDQPGKDAETELLSMALPPGAMQIDRRRLILPAGEQLITLESDGPGGAYEVILTRSDPVRVTRTLAVGEQPRQGIQPGQWMIFQVSDGELTLPILPESGEENLWQLQLIAELGTPLTARLEGLADSAAPIEVLGLAAEQRWSRLALADSSRLHFKRADGQPVGRVGFRLVDDGPLESGPMSASADVDNLPRWLEFDHPVRVSLAGGEQRTLSFQLDDGQASNGLAIELGGENKTPVEVCLIERDVRRPHCSRGRIAQVSSVCEDAAPGVRDPVCRRALSGAVFAGIELEAGSYDIRLQNPERRASIDPVLLLRADDRSRPGQARQPNDHPHWAVPLVPGETLTGRLPGQRSAFFDVVIPADSHYWSLSAEGDALQALRIGRWRDVRDSIAEATSANGASVLVHQRLNLPPGRYRIELRGEDSDYRLALQPADPPPPGTENEPNDEPRLANPVVPGQTIGGDFHSPADRDWFHFHLPGWNRVNLGVAPPSDGDLRLRLYWGEHPLMQTVALDEPTALSAFLPAGDYYLVLDGPSESSRPYAVELGLDAPWHHAAAAHPVPFWRHPGPLPDSGQVGRVVGGVEHTVGYFQLPIGASDRVVTVRHRPGVIEATFYDEDGTRLPCGSDSANRVCELSVAAGQQVVVETLQTPRANRAIIIEDPLDSGSVEPDAVALSLSSPSERIAANQGLRQKVPVRLVIEANGHRGRLPLSWHLSHQDASIDGLPEALDLDNDQALTLDLEVDLPAQLSPDLPVSLFLRAGSRHGRLDWSPATDQAVLSGYQAPDPPEHLAGRVNLAWSALGAVFIDPDTGEPAPLRIRERAVDHYVGLDQLIDDQATLGSYLRWGREMGEPLPPLRLARGGGRVHALSFNNLSGHALSARWAQVEVAFGDQDRQFGEARLIELDPSAGEQIFELETPVDARYVQLTPRRSWGASPFTGAGLMRVLGEPFEPGEPADLLSPKLGGHVVWTQPPLDRQLRVYTQVERLPDLLADARPLPIRGRSQTLVFGMNQNRAARLSALGWLERDDPDGQAAEQLRVWTSTAGPAGPWEDRGGWTLARDAHGQASLAFEEPVWARYIRLDIRLPDPDHPDQPAAWNLPAAVSAWEAKALSSGESVLGWWGHDRMTGPYERLVAPSIPFWPVDDHDSHPHSPLALDAARIGELAGPGDTRSYRLDLPEGANSLFVALEEDQPGRTDLRLVGPDGEIIETRAQRHRSGQVALSLIGLAPGQYRLDVIHQPRNIVFIWDGSGSIAEHQPVIYQALNRFAEELAPKHERANLIALGGPLMIDGWADRPEQIRRTLAEYDNRYAGSDSEPALALATRAAAREPGEAVIFLITDAELVGRDLSAWDALQETRPRIFALEINHGEDDGSDAHRHYQQLMQNWALIGGGQYHYASDRSSLIRAFESGMAQIRQPGRFRISAETAYRDPPRPGSLQILSGDQPAVGGAVVHLIFDASGSMLRRMEGGRRIDVAKRIVREILDQRIPESVPIALRAYGHTEPHSCETELLVPPTANNHDRVRTTVDRIQAINLARTPLAASIDAVVKDLEGFEDDHRLVVMLTDGEETCDGDVEAAVERLVATGVDVRLNIVGFHIDELGLQGDFERFASMGRGEYFDSQDGEELIRGLEQALAATFHVFDREGLVVASGRVDGDAVELLPGTYELQINDQSGQRRQPLQIEASGRKQLTLGENF